MRTDCSLLVALSLLVLGGALWAASVVTLVFEGENYTWVKPSMRKVADKAASNGAYVEIPLQRPHGTEESAPFDDGSVTFKINIPQAGTYRLWVRAHWYDPCGNSFFVMGDDMSPEVPAFISDATCQKWHWAKGAEYTLSAGYHLIRFQNREDGAKLDEFLLTTSSQLVPTRLMKETSQYLWHAPE